MTEKLRVMTDLLLKDCHAAFDYLGNKDVPRFSGTHTDKIRRTTTFALANRIEILIAELGLAQANKEVEEADEVQERAQHRLNNVKELQQEATE